MAFNLKNIYNSLIYGTDLVAIEHHAKNESTNIAYVKARFKKDTVEVLKTFKASSINEINFDTKETPVRLVITSDNVLTKRIDKITSEKALENTFPNLNMEDFYYEVFQSKDHTFVSVCRKDYVDNLLSEYENNGITVIEFHIGNYAIQSIVQYIEESELITLSSKISLTNKSISSITKLTSPTESNSYNFGNETVYADFLLPFSVIVNSISKNIVTESNTQERNFNLNNSFKETRFFKLILMSGIGLLLLSLLINFFIFSNKYEAFQKLNEDKQLFKTQEKQLKKRIEDLNKKEALVKAIQYNGFSKSSNYIDRIINSIPESITLKNLIYQPVLKNIKKNKKVELNENYISVSGKTNNKLSLNNWINNIQELDFISNVDIMNYSQVNNSTANFQIDLKLKKDDSEK